MKNLHKEFVRLGRERNKITYKLLALLPKIDELKIYEQHGYANIYDYAAKIAGLSGGVVQKALKIEGKLKDLPYLKKTIETQGINKVGIVVGLATKENEKELAEKVENMSKPALQEYSKEVRGKITTSWQVELDEDMMFMLLKLKKEFGKNLSNKECLRKVLEKMSGKMVGRGRQAKIPGENSPRPITRYITVYQKSKLSDRCIHKNCYRPADVIHHPDRFSKCRDHENLKPLCKSHHEFAHNGITEPMRDADYNYRKCRMKANSS